MGNEVPRESRGRLTLYGLLLGLCLALGIALGITLPLLYRKTHKGEPNQRKFESRLGNFSQAAVATDAAQCAPVGRYILEVQNGSAVEAAIATLLCMGVVIPHSTGIGGGFLMTIYKKETGQVRVLDAREVAPRSATEDMFQDKPYQKVEGGLSVAVPGELRGFEWAHKEFGVLEWHQLFEPAIKLARNGFRVGKHLAAAIELQRDKLTPNDTLRNLLIKPNGGELYRYDDLMKNERLADTLQMIAQAGNADPFYTGPIAQDTIKAIRGDGGIMETEDLAEYKPVWREAITVSGLTASRLTLHSAPPPGSGALLALILNTLSRYGPDNATYAADPALFYHRLLETYKFAYAQRTLMEDSQDDAMTQLLAKLTSTTFAEKIQSLIDDQATFHDPGHYGAEVAYARDHGTAHVCVLAPNGDAVAVSSTINVYFGSRLLTPLGVLLNDEMDDFNSPNITNAFGVPPSGANLIKPGRRPFSSMAPSILTDQRGHVRMVVGASGGTHITTGIASVILRSQWLGESIKAAIDAPRIHHQLYPNASIYEKEFSPSVLSGLTSRGHVVSVLRGRGAVVEGIVRDDDNDIIYANADYRKEGAVDGY